MFTYRKEYKDKDEDKNKCDDCIKGIIALFNFVCLILLIIWLFKIINNAKDEPSHYSQLISNDSLKNYTESDFCYGRKYEYSKFGAFKLFHIQMEKIKKYARGLLATKFISIILSIISICAWWSYNKSYKTSTADKNIFIFSIFFTLFYLANCILNVVFNELLSNNFSQSNFEDFETFSKCAYLKSNFRIKYKFMNKVKKNCEKIFVVNLISSILEALNVF